MKPLVTNESLEVLSKKKHWKDLKKKWDEQKKTTAATNCGVNNSIAPKCFKKLEIKCDDNEQYSGQYCLRI